MVSLSGSGVDEMTMPLPILSVSPFA